VTKIEHFDKVLIEMSDQTISFGDHVRVRSAPITEQKSLAGLDGHVHGETTPSVTGVEVIGELKVDYALNVYFDALGQGYWFTAELLEFIDHAEGTVITLKGVPKKWTRAANGEWVEESIEENQSSSKVTKKPWWKFW
jgi:hypothetical protein